MKHLTKWLLVTAATLLACSVAIGAAGLLLLRGSLYKTAEERGGVILENIGTRMEQEMTALSGAADFLCGSETTQYFTAYSVLLSAERAAALKAAFEAYLHGTALNTDLVETVVFIGENENQASYVYDTRTGAARGVAVPTFEKWYRSGLAELLLGNGSFFYIDDSVSETALNADYLETYPGQRPMLREWLDLLRGHYGFLQLREHFTVLFLLRGDFFARAAAPFAGEWDAVSLEQPDGRRVACAGWAGRADAGSAVWRGARPLAGTKLTIACERRPDTGVYRTFILVFAACVILLSVAALLLVRIRSKRILAPFDHLTARIRASIDSDDFEAISLDDPGLRKVRPLHTSIFRLFLTGLMVPSLLLGVVCSLLVNRELSARLWSLSELRATALQESLKTNLQLSEDILRLISQKPDFASVAGGRVTGQDAAAEWQRTLRLNSYVNRYPLGMYNVSYLVLLDAQGSARYQSLYRDEDSARNQLDGFSLSRQPEAMEQLGTMEGDIGLLVCDNIYQQATASVIKSLYDGEGRPVGYLQMVYNPNYFQMIGARQSADYLLLRQPGGQLVFNSGGDALFTQAAALLDAGQTSATVAVGGYPYLATHAGRVEGSDWALVVFQRADDLLRLSYAVLGQNLLMVGALMVLLFVFSWGLSRLRRLWQDGRAQQPGGYLQSGHRSAQRADGRYGGEEDRGAAARQSADTGGARKPAPADRLPFLSQYARKHPHAGAVRRAGKRLPDARGAVPPVQLRHDAARPHRAGEGDRVCGELYPDPAGTPARCL